VEPWLAEAVDAERRAPPADAERFLARLRLRLASSPREGRVHRIPALSWAALIPVALALWWLFARGPAVERGAPAPGAPPSTEGAIAGETDLIEELDVLELLAELVPAGPDDRAPELDPELIDLYVDLEIIEEFPVETLGSSG